MKRVCCSELSEDADCCCDEEEELDAEEDPPELPLSALLRLTPS